MAAKLLTPKVNPGSKVPQAAINTIGRSQSTRGNLNTPSTAPVDRGGPQKLAAKNIPAAEKNTGTANKTLTAGENPPAAAPAISPFLTPDQSDAFAKAWNDYQGAAGTDTANLKQAGLNEQATIDNDAQIHTQDTATAQAQSASRGMFTSSIKDGALNSIDATQLNNDHAAINQLGALSTSINADLKRLNDNWGADQLLYTAYGAANAAASDNSTPPAQTDQSYTAPNSGPAVATGLLGAGAGLEGSKSAGVGAGLQGAGAGISGPAAKQVAQKITRNKSKDAAKPTPGLIGAAGQSYGRLS